MPNPDSIVPRAPVPPPTFARSPTNLGQDAAWVHVAGELDTGADLGSLQHRASFALESRGYLGGVVAGGDKGVFRRDRGVTRSDHLHDHTNLSMAGARRVSAQPSRQARSDLVVLAARADERRELPPTGRAVETTGLGRLDGS